MQISAVFQRSYGCLTSTACVESFFGNLKAEWVKEKIYETFEDGQKDIFNYIEVFYNRKRRHASLGYVSPVVYEEMHEMKQGRAA